MGITELKTRKTRHTLNLNKISILERLNTHSSIRMYSIDPMMPKIVAE